MEKDKENLTKKDLQRYERIKQQLEEMSRELRTLETKKQRAERQRINHAKFLYAGFLIANLKPETLIKDLETCKNSLKRDADREDIDLLIKAIKQKANV